jgi:uncharacterized secreted protein with C-terminal beta-propeller domain
MALATPRPSASVDAGGGRHLSERMLRMRTVRPTTCLLAAGAALMTAATPAEAARRAPRLQAFSSCESLVHYARAGAVRTGGTTGVVTRAVASPLPALQAPFPATGDMVTAAPAAQADGRGGAEAQAPFSTTNVQEQGVDEPDVVKTDGKRLVSIAGGVLHVVDLTGDLPREVGRLQLDGAGHQLLLRGDRVLVSSTNGRVVPLARAAIAPVPYGTQRTTLTEVDLRDPAAPKVARTLELDGAYVDARLTGGTARIVVASSPEPIAVPAGGTVRGAVRRAGLRHFVPLTTLRSRITRRTFRRPAVACTAVRRPRAFSGLDLLTVLTVDLDQGLFSVDRDAVMAGVEVVYGSTSSLYIASRRYSPALDGQGNTVPPAVRTELHRFDASQRGQTTYVASGDVAGFVLNQFSLSELDGRLRVATTEEPAWFGDANVRESESGISVLEEHDGRLQLVGHVGGLGKRERIYSVRFLGDAAYVVTFRQVDPLYAVDLSDPSKPRVRGELKILGYSSYLHPLGDGLLLGVGQDATPEGRRAGTQLSVFDVSDLDAPKKLAGVALGVGSSSDAENDHHAFLYWDPTRLAVIPLQRYAYDDPQQPPYAGAVGFRVARGAITEVGRIQHPADSGELVPIGRSIVVGDRLLTLSAAGLATNRLDDLGALGFLPLRPSAG